MKVSAIIVSSIILAGSFLVVVQSCPLEDSTPCSESTGVTDAPTECGLNMFAQNCFPCNQVCNGPASLCARECGTLNNMCKCNEGTYLPVFNSTYCVPQDECPPPS